MVNRTRKTDFIPLGNGQSVGSVVNSNNQYVLDFGTDDRRIVQVGNDPNVSGAADFTLTVSQTGSTVRLTALTSCDVTLPTAAAAGKGARYTFMCEALVTSGSGHSIIPASGDGIGGAGLTYTNDADLLLAAASDALGDFVTLESDGLLDWHIVAIKGTWSKV